MNVLGTIRCERCYGKGEVDYPNISGHDYMEDCPVCKGSGTVPAPVPKISKSLSWRVADHTRRWTVTVIANTELLMQWIDALHPVDRTALGLKNHWEPEQRMARIAALVGHRIMIDMACDSGNEFDEQNSTTTEYLAGALAGISEVYEIPVLSGISVTQASVRLPKVDDLSLWPLEVSSGS